MIVTDTPAASMLSAPEVRLLTEIGFVAAGRGWLDHARTIFEALMRLRPGRAFPYLGLGLALINAGRADEAALLLERATAIVQSAANAEHDASCAGSDNDGDRALLSAYHAVALQFSGRQADSARVLRALADRPARDPTGRIARSMLGVPAPSENFR